MSLYKPSTDRRGPVFLEYIWISADGTTRSKTRVVYPLRSRGVNPEHKKHTIPSHVKQWSYDGSKTGQADGSESEIILIPCAIYRDPFRGLDPKTSPHRLVLCKAVDLEGLPVSGNTRLSAEHTFNTRKSEDIWFGLEQEYVLYNRKIGHPISEDHIIGWSSEGIDPPQGQYYCRVDIPGRDIAEEHMIRCLDSGVIVSGMNAEAMIGQWKYQIGPCSGIEAGDDHWMSRYILDRVCVKYKLRASLDPKPVSGEHKGSGCHTNFSTKSMRDCGTEEIFLSAIERLEAKHKVHMEQYGEGNERRLSKNIDTLNSYAFSYGVGNRDASVRIPIELHNRNYKSGYLEDRRPSSRMDPYVVTRCIAETIVPV
jgi:glutamine synthetase